MNMKKLNFVVKMGSFWNSCYTNWILQLGEGDNDWIYEDEEDWADEEDEGSILQNCFTSWGKRKTTLDK